MLTNIRFVLLFISFFFAACSRSAHSAPWLAPSSFVNDPPLMEATEAETSNSLMPPTHAPGEPILTPTPDAPRILPAFRDESLEHIVRWGDTLQMIADTYQVSMELIIRENNIQNPNLISPGQALVIPPPIVVDAAPGYKMIPDSELVNGPYSVSFDLEGFVEQQGGYLSNYREKIEDQKWSGVEIIHRVADQYSVNPRLLLAVLEHQSSWVTGGKEEKYPLGYRDPNTARLYRQLCWAANQLNRGYYAWRVDGLNSYLLPDYVTVPVNTTVNAGTAGVQYFFSRLLPHDTWRKTVSENGFEATYRTLFGYPFDFAYEPLIPPDLAQPPLQLPFEEDVVWSFTGGPHGGWDSGSAWAALDFAPPPGNVGCLVSSHWVVAAADGMIVRSEDGAVMQSIDGDSFAQTGWSLLYMHIDSHERVQAGTFLQAGERIGHPSCEGGISSGTHLHLARLYNGEWIPADQNIPFNLEGWISYGSGDPYQGTMRRGDQVIRADALPTNYNRISRSSR